MKKAGFEAAHSKWFKWHVDRRSGERKDRLIRGHNHGEKEFLRAIWWLLIGNFDNLHPEYEVKDWQGQSFFVDFVWSIGIFKFAFEIKGFGPHVQRTDRRRYARELNREIYLQTQGFRVVAIPYDTIEENPDQIISLLKALLAPYLVASSQDDNLTRVERETLRIAMSTTEPVRPIDLEEKLEINHRTSVKVLKSLCDKGKLRPIQSAKKSAKSSRVTKYEYIHSYADDIQW